MQKQILRQSVEYNDLVGEVFSKVEFSSLRNNPHLLWMKRGVISLREAIKNLMSIKIFNKKGKIILERNKKNYYFWN